MKKWIYVIVAVCLFVYMCGGGDDTESPVDDSVPSWIQGKWECRMPNGVLTLEINGNHYRESFGDGEYFEGTFHIQDDAIMTGQTFYQMDFDRKRLAAGSGYYFEKK